MSVEKKKSIRYLIKIHLENAATWGAAGGVGAEEDEVGEQDGHLGGQYVHEQDEQDNAIFDECRTIS